MAELKARAELVEGTARFQTHQHSAAAGRLHHQSLGWLPSPAGPIPGQIAAGALQLRIAGWGLGRFPRLQKGQQRRPAAVGLGVIHEPKRQTGSGALLEQAGQAFEVTVLGIIGQLIDPGLHTTHIGEGDSHPGRVEGGDALAEAAQVIDPEQLRPVGIRGRGQMPAPVAAEGEAEFNRLSRDHGTLHLGVDVGRRGGVHGAAPPGTGDDALNDPLSRSRFGGDRRVVNRRGEPGQGRVQGGALGGR